MEVILSHSFILTLTNHSYLDSDMDQYGHGEGYMDEDGNMHYADGDMMGSEDDGMGHGDSYGHEGSPGYGDVSIILSTFIYNIIFILCFIAK